MKKFILILITIITICINANADSGAKCLLQHKGSVQFFDGDKIAALLLVFFKNWPQLIEKKIICRSISPIIIAKKGKDRRKYYSIEEFNKEEKKLKGYMVKYAKGLSGLDAEETKDMMRNPIYLNFDYDELADDMFNRWFGEDSDQRKKLMEI